jgi:hypothetical protein
MMYFASKALAGLARRWPIFAVGQRLLGSRRY